MWRYSPRARGAPSATWARRQTDPYPPSAHLDVNALNASGFRVKERLDKFADQLRRSVAGSRHRPTLEDLELAVPAVSDYSAGAVPALHPAPAVPAVDLALSLQPHRVLRAVFKATTVASEPVVQQVAERRAFPAHHPEAYFHRRRLPDHQKQHPIDAESLQCDRVSTTMIGCRIVLDDILAA